MLYRRMTSFVGFLALLASVPVQAATINFAPVADIRILSIFPDSNEALGSLLSVWTQPGNVQRTLLQFDLSGIPSGGQIDSATLTLYANSTYFSLNPTGLAMNVHAVTSPWTELGVSWNSASTGTPWATPGGDFAPLVYATSTANPAVHEPVIWDITALVVDWYDASIDNNGLLIQSFLGNGLGFESRHLLDAALRPVLTVTYTAVPEMGSMMLAGVGFVGFVAAAIYRQRRLRSELA